MFWKNKKPVPATLELVQEIDGYKFYTPINLIEGTIAKRYMKFRAIIENRDVFKLDYDSRKIVLAELKRAIDDNEIARASQWVGLLEVLNDETYWDEELFQVANCFLIMEGEPHNDFDEDFVKLKRRLFNENENIKLFFLQFGHEYLRHINDLPENSSILDYMNKKQQKIINLTYARLISQAKSKESGIN